MAGYWPIWAEHQAEFIGGLEFTGPLMDRWRKLVARSEGAVPSSFYQANRMLANLEQSSRWGGLSLFSSDEMGIRAYCERRADEFKRGFSVRGRFDQFTIMSGLYHVAGFLFKPMKRLADHCLSLVDAGNVRDGEKFLQDWTARINRLVCWRWWQRQCLKARRRFREEVSRYLGDVHAKKQIYISDLSFNDWQHRQRESWDLLQKMELENDQGQRFKLSDLVLKSVSNPAIRRMEMMTRVKGFELLAEKLGYKGAFITITCPSRFHRMIHRKSKKKEGKNYVFENKNWDGSSVRDGQTWLNDVWTRVRARLSSYGVDYFGVRVAEPHHDGCPHWHLLLFGRDDQLERIEQEVRTVALADSPSEPGANVRRVQVERIKDGINPDTGRPYSAAGYVAKYISKAIDGFGIESDLYGNDASRSARRIRCWASVHSIRQFQFFGGVPITHWRECRRLARQFCTFTDDGKKLVFDYQKMLEKAEEQPKLQRFLFALADLELTSDAAEAFCNFNLWARNCQLTLDTLREPVTELAMDELTGELVDEVKTGIYGDDMEAIKGLNVLLYEFDDGERVPVEWERVVTRPYQWRIVPPAGASPPGEKVTQSADDMSRLLGPDHYPVWMDHELETDMKPAARLLFG